MKNSTSSVLLLFVLIFGVALLAYPTMSDYWNQLHQSRAIEEYAEAVVSVSNEDYEKYWQAAVDYNNDSINRTNPYVQTEQQRQDYENILNISGSGVMGYIEIPVIEVNLPVYHGTSETVLQKAIGHLIWASLPVGGAGSHCILSGHRGLPSAKLFSDLTELNVGDLFFLRVLNETLTYEVDQILTVLPDDTEALRITQGKDYCTLVTCTPYGVNSHRLLVRGHRIENPEEASVIRVTADAIQIEPVLVAPIVALPILVILMLWLTKNDKKQGRKKDADDE